MNYDVSSMYANEWKQSRYYLNEIYTSVYCYKQATRTPKIVFFVA